MSKLWGKLHDLFTILLSWTPADLPKDSTNFLSNVCNEFFRGTMLKLEVQEGTGRLEESIKKCTGKALFEEVQQKCVMVAMIL